MSKRFKGQTCAYCAVAGASGTGDHVPARAFLPIQHRGQIPQVPACKACNKEKSDLEHYLSTVLLFGGRHADAAANLTTDGPRRLAKNKKLHRELAAGVSHVWSKEPSGLLVRSMAVPIDGARIEKLVGLQNCIEPGMKPEPMCSITLSASTIRSAGTLQSDI